MVTFYNLQQALHHGKLEMFRGELVPCFEVPARAYFVLQKLARRGLGPVQPPQESSTPRTPPLPQPSDHPAHRPATVSALGFEATLTTIHTSRYLDFPAQAWAEWAALDPANAAKDAFPQLWPVRSFRTDVLPVNFSARMGLFLLECRKFLQSRWAFCTRVNENNDLHHWHGKCLANLDCPLAKAGAVNGLIGKIPGVPANY